MPIVQYDGETQANDLFTSLTSDSPAIPNLDLTGSKFDFTRDENSDLHGPVSTVTLEQLTEVDLEGAGIFDKLMKAMDGHIQREYKGNRITGDQYAKVYTEVVTAVLGQSVVFLLQRDQAKWNAISAQMQARIFEVQAAEAIIKHEETKVKAQQTVFEMYNAGAQYALTKMQVANADVAYDLAKTQQATAEYQLDNLLPVQLSKEQYLLNSQLPAQTDLLLEQTETQRSQTLDVRTDSAPVTGLVGRQKSLLEEQLESERSKTMDTRSDGATTIEGSVGKQKDLYDQQIDSFIKDAKQKAAKMYLDGWTIQKTVDENLASPNELDVPSVSAVLLSLRQANGL